MMIYLICDAPADAGATGFGPFRGVGISWTA